MAKPIKKDGKLYRIRRGKLVEIPAEWIGKVTSQQTINKRPSKQLHKHRKYTKLGFHAYNRRHEREHRKQQRAAVAESLDSIQQVDNTSLATEVYRMNLKVKEVTILTGNGPDAINCELEAETPFPEMKYPSGLQRLSLMSEPYNQSLSLKH